MSNYRLNLNSQANGDHEVHVEGCIYYNDLVNFRRLGNHPNCHSAVSAANTIVGDDADGCKVCIPQCHTS